jgi:hypothetical protein
MITIEEIKAELREMIALGDAATAGPWESFIDDTGGEMTGWPTSIDAVNEADKSVVRTGGQWPYDWDASMSRIEAVANAAFIARSRTMTPLACKGLLLAIEGLEVYASLSGPIALVGGDARNQLESIRKLWEETK